jgi:hypothetical protein
MSGLLLEFTSHIPGRNAKVAIYDDRIDWGLLAGLPGSRNDTNTILLSQIREITTHRDGLRFTVVTVATAAYVTEFRVIRAEAAKITATITALMPRAAQHVPRPARAAAGRDSMWRQPTVRNAIAAARRRRDDRADD